MIGPPLGWITGGIDFSNLFVVLKGGHYATLADAAELCMNCMLRSYTICVLIHVSKLSGLGEVLFPELPVAACAVGAVEFFLAQLDAANLARDGLG